MFFNFFSQDLLIAFQIQKYNFYYSLVLVTINISLALLLVGDYSNIGVGFAKLLASFSGAIFMYLIIKKYQFFKIRINYRILLWSIILGVLFYFIFRHLSFLVYMILTPFIITIFTIVIGFFNKKEIQLMVGMLGLKDSDRLMKYLLYRIF